MGFLRKILDHGHRGGHRRNGHDDHHGSYRADHHDANEAWGRHPGSIPPMPPDAICPLCRKSNPPGTRLCSQCATPLERHACVQCGAAVQRGAAFCARCGSSVR